MRTEAQKKADANLVEAIQAVVREYDSLPEDAHLTDFIVVAEAIKFDEQGDLESTHQCLLYREGNTRDSVAFGLLECGRRMIWETPRMGDDDGD